jgi:hypothetical protein
MITIKSPEDIVKARLPPQLASYVASIMNGILRSIPDYTPEDDGHIIVVTPTDTDEKLCAVLGSRYADNMWEGVSFNPDFNCYNGTYITNNQFTVTVIFQCEALLDPAIIARMVREVA